MLGCGSALKPDELDYKITLTQSTIALPFPRHVCNNLTGNNGQRFDRLANDYNNFLLDYFKENDKKINGCLLFWKDMYSMNSRNIFYSHFIIIKNILNLRYFKYFSGFKGAFRDSICNIIIRKERGI